MTREFLFRHSQWKYNTTCIQIGIIIFFFFSIDSFVVIEKTAIVTEITLAVTFFITTAATLVPFPFIASSDTKCIVVVNIVVVIVVILIASSENRSELDIIVNRLNIDGNVISSFEFCNILDGDRKREHW